MPEITSSWRPERLARFWRAFATPMLQSVGLGLLVVLSLTILTACAATLATGTETADRVACQAFEPITYSASQDSEETQIAIREHNAAWDAVCAP